MTNWRNNPSVMEKFRAIRLDDTMSDELELAALLDLAVAASGSPPSTETALAAARWDALMDNVSSTSLEPDEIRLHLIGVTLPDLFGPHKVDWSMRTCHDIADKLMARAASGSTGAPSDQPTPETEK